MFLAFKLCSIFPNILSERIFQSTDQIPERSVVPGVEAGRATPHTCCQVTPSAASSALTSPPLPTPSESLPSRPSPPWEPTAFRSYLLKKLPTTKQTKGRSEDERGQRGWRVGGGRSVPAFPLQPLPGQPPPGPCLALIPRVYPPSSQPSPLRRDRARRLHRRHLALGPDLLCRGPATRGPAGASPSTTPRPAAPGRPGPGWPASAAGPSRASGSARSRAPGRVAGRGASTVAFPQKRPGAGRRTRFGEKLASGFAV